MAAVIARTPTSFTTQIEVPYNESMPDFEEALQERLNEAGVVATAEGLRQFDTDGPPVTVGPVMFTSKGQVENDDQTPTASPPSPATSTRATGAVRRTTPSSARPVPGSTPRRTTAGPSPAA